MQTGTPAMQTGTPSVANLEKIPDADVQQSQCRPGGHEGVESPATCCRGAGYVVADATFSTQGDGASES